MNSCCPSGAPAAVDLAGSFSFGLLISAGHCVGMCGPLAAAVSASARARGGRFALLGALPPYHFGRLISYAVLGAVVGSLGSVIGLWQNPRPYQAVLSLAAGSAMVVLGLGLVGALPMSRLAAPSFGCGLIHRSGGPTANGWQRRLGFGIANGFLPCGPVYAAAVAAGATGSAFTGALSMFVFGLGTVPVLALVGLGAGAFGPRLRTQLRSVGAVLIFVMAGQLMLRGCASLGWIPHLRFGEVVAW